MTPGLTFPREALLRASPKRPSLLRSRCVLRFERTFHSAKGLVVSRIGLMFPFVFRRRPKAVNALTKEAASTRASSSHRARGSLRSTSGQPATAFQEVESVRPLLSRHTFPSSRTCISSAPSKMTSTFGAVVLVVCAASAVRRSCACTIVGVHTGGTSRRHRNT
ncbi:hypothetical protein PENSPDRAFT_354561 [Peniophora sp. CONT]|nr:hypothetical protein PENSPDRAFT_354561 [Peniophora sp. CONT]